MNALRWYKCYRIIRLAVDEAEGLLLMLPDSSNFTRIYSARGKVEAAGTTCCGLQYLVYLLIKEVYRLEFPCV